MCPLYAYECKECNYSWEDVHPISERMWPMQQPCPGCEKDTEIIRLMNDVLLARDKVVNPRKKMGEGFKETMTALKKNHPSMRSDHF